MTFVLWFAGFVIGGVVSGFAFFWALKRAIEYAVGRGLNL